MVKVWMGLLAGLLVIGLVSCSNEEQENLFEAQICIDRLDIPSTARTDSAVRETVSGQVDGCLAKIAGQSSDQANVLKCAGEFIRQGIAEEAIVNAIKDLDNANNQSGDPSAATIDNLAFGTIDNNSKSVTELASEAVSVCTQSGSTTLIALAGAAQIATTLKLANDIRVDGMSVSQFFFCYKNDGTNLTTEQTATYNETIANGGCGGAAADFNLANADEAAEKEALAEALTSNEDSLCNDETGLFKDNEFCKNFDAPATGSGDPCESFAGDVVDLFLCNSRS